MSCLRAAAVRLTSSPKWQSETQQDVHFLPLLSVKEKSNAITSILKNYFFKLIISSQTTVNTSTYLQINGMVSSAEMLCLTTLEHEVWEFLLPDNSTYKSFLYSGIECHNLSFWLSS